MKAGKLSEAELKRSVLRQLHSLGDRAQIPAVGQDGALVRTDGADVVCAVSAMPAASAMRVPVTVYTACNNLACCGADPVGILVSLLLPTAADEQIVKNMMGEIDAVCDAEHMQVLGGHTEVTRQVTEPVLSVTAVGMLRGDAPTGKTVRPGMDILVTNRVGTAGAAILAHAREEELRSRYAQPFLDRAKQTAGGLSIRTTARAALQSGAAAMHDVSSGGIYGALWEFAENSGVGLEIYLKAIPIRQETVEICEFFQLNPYKLLSTGSLLIAAEDGGTVASKIRQANGEAAVIGKITGGNDRVLLCGEERRFLETAQTDELYKIIRS